MEQQLRSELISALSLDKIEAWVKEYYASGNVIYNGNWPITRHCVVAVYLNSTMKDKVDDWARFSQGLTHTQVYTHDGRTIDDMPTPQQVLYLVRLVDRLPDKKQFELDELVGLISLAREQYKSDFSPEFMKDYEARYNANQV